MSSPPCRSKAWRAGGYRDARAARGRGRKRAGGAWQAAAAPLIKAIGRLAHEAGCCLVPSARDSPGASNGAALCLVRCSRLASLGTLNRCLSQQQAPLGHSQQQAPLGHSQQQAPLGHSLQQVACAVEGRVGPPRPRVHLPGRGLSPGRHRPAGTGPKMRRQACSSSSGDRPGHG